MTSPNSSDLGSSNLSSSKLDSAIQIAVGVCAVVALLLAMDTLRMFGSEQWLEQIIRVETQYYFALLALLLPFAFLLYPSRWWLDWPMSIATWVVLGYFYVNAELALDEAWEFDAPEMAVLAALCLWLLLLEALRRVAGWALFLIAGLFSLLPIFAEQMPSMLSGLEATWQETSAYHALSIESLFGLPFRAFAELVMGFLLFGVALQFTGGGRFFLDLAFALLGKSRGGPAKVSILSSGLMGSMSGSVVTNVLTTGQLTIPAMKRAGMSGTIAGAIEACASTGGVLLPPIMGSTAFVMATLLEVPYVEVATAAALPAMLYFMALYVQLDAYAGRHALAGLEDSAIPKLGATMAAGWFYLGAFALLVFLLLFLQREAVAPYYATAALLVMNQLVPSKRLDWRGWIGLSQALGRLLVELAVILAGVGLIVGSLSLTGLSGTLVNDLLFIAGDNVGLLLLMGAATSFVLGIGMTVTAAYIFLAIVLAPALQEASFAPLSIHLFILYWAMLSFITPPVALGAFAAASIAKASPLATGFAAMRLGSILYFIPFIFVLDPNFILQGTPLGAVQVFVEALIGVWLLAGALQGYLPGVGRLDNMLLRLLYGLAGALIAAPSLAAVVPQAPSNALCLGLGVILALVAGAVTYGTRQRVDRIV